MQPHYKVLIGAAALVAASAGAAIAAPSGPETPANCTFSNGTTTCAVVGAPVQSSTASAPDANGCTTTTTVTTVTTTYVAHHGTYNSKGVAVAGPPSTSTSSSETSAPSCPTNAPSAQSVCQQAGGVYAEGGTNYLGNVAQFAGPGPYTVNFTCTVPGQTVDQANALVTTLQPFCRAATYGVSTVWNDDPTYDANPFVQANVPANGWYYMCYQDPSLYGA